MASAVEAKVAAAAEAEQQSLCAEHHPGDTQDHNPVKKQHDPNGAKMNEWHIPFLCLKAGLPREPVS